MRSRPRDAAPELQTGPSARLNRAPVERSLLRIAVHAIIIHGPAVIPHGQALLRNKDGTKTGTKTATFEMRHIPSSVAEMTGDTPKDGDQGGSRRGD
jgi:hypothetical protein